MAEIFKSTLLKKTKETSDYSAKDISVLDGIEAVRQRVSYYMGASDSDAIYQMIKEGTDNASDEFQAGKNSFVGVEIWGDEILVYDKGRGIPVDIHPKTKQPAIIDIFTKLHAGGKFGSKAYGTSAGVHGVGITATNALSKTLEVWTFREGKWYNIQFKKGRVVTPLNTKTPPPKLQNKIKCGTILKFTPDLSRFDEGSKLSIKKLREGLDFASYIHGGLEYYLKTPKNEYTFLQKEGLLALLNKKIEEAKVTPLSKPFYLKKDNITVALCWTASSDEKTDSFVSGSYTREGGTHLNGLYKAINDAIKPYKGKKEFTPGDLRSGLFIILNVGVKEPKFSSQSKERLTSDYVADEVFEAIKPEIDKFFTSNKAMIKRIVDQAAEVAKMMSKVKLDKKNLLEMRKASKSRLPSKLTACTTKDRSKIELFLVEGESASGPAKAARDTEYQAILELRGKLINAYTAKDEKLMANTEVQDILNAVGYVGDPNVGTDINKIIFLTDPDKDALHIEVLLATLFKRILPKAFAQGKIYIIRTPLYNCQYKGKRYFAKDQKELLAQIGGQMPPGGIQRVKGLGELNADKLGDIAFEKATRNLIRVTDSIGDDEKAYISIVGKGSETRKELLEISET